MLMLRPPAERLIRRQVSVSRDLLPDYFIQCCRAGLLKITPEQYACLKDLNFKIGSKTYSLTPNGQIWPRSLNTDIGGDSGSIYLIVSDVSSFISCWYEVYH